jgi:hypothetical protein
MPGGLAERRAALDRETEVRPLPRQFESGPYLPVGFRSLEASRPIRLRTYVRWMIELENAFASYSTRAG